MELESRKQAWQEVRSEDGKRERRSPWSWRCTEGYTQALLASQGSSYAHVTDQYFLCLDLKCFSYMNFKIEFYL